MKRRLLVPLLAAALTALPATPAAGATQPNKRRVPVVRPAPGHVSLTAVTIRATVPRGARPRLRTRFPKAQQLPPSVRVLWATRKVRRGRKLRVSLLILSIN